MANAACPLCGRGPDDARTVVESGFNLTGAAGKAYRVVECQGCRFRYLWPRPEPAELAAFYEADYPAHALKVGAGGSASPEQASIDRRFGQVASRRIELVRQALGRAPDGLQVLDIGCGNGAFLLELTRRHEIEGWGLDIAGPALNALGRLAPRLRLVRGDLAGADLPHAAFDIITLWHVLEHDADPVGSLKRVARWLKPGGLVLAEVPNATGRIARLCGADWLGWDLPRHLVHFAPETLRASAERAGLERVVVRREYTLNPVTLSPLLASLAIGQRRRRGKTRMKRVAYHQWDGLRSAGLRVVNGLERLLGGNGLLLVARAPSKMAPPSRFAA